MEWEICLIEWMQNNLRVFGSVFGKFFSFLGGETGALLLFLIVLFCWKKEVGLRLGIILAATNTWLPMIKTAVLRPRPYMQHPDRVEALALVDSSAAKTDIAAQGYSFPSMHSACASSFYFYLAGAIKKKWFWIVAVAVTLSIGISRVVVGMHYPTDVFAGWMFGLASIGIFLLLEKYVKKEWIRHIIILVSVLPGVFFVRTNDYFTALGLIIGIIVVIPFERKYVGFKDTKNIFAMILRIVFAFALYLAMNTLLKMPFSTEFLESGSLAAYLIRTARYAIIVFTVVGIYPKVFPLFEKNRKE